MISRTQQDIGAATAMHPYAARVLSELGAASPWEELFLSSVEELLEAIGPALHDNPHFEHEAVLERLVEPERVAAFRVVWTDDRQRVRVNRGWRVRFHTVLGPGKGGLRFHSSVGLASIKSLAFVQVFKNALTGTSLGGAKGGSDLSTRFCSESEMMRFCQSFMTGLWEHIGPDVDVPAGDIGVGAREIGYLYGQYRRLSQTFAGAITGKGAEWGGSSLRPEATGYGASYFVDEMLRERGESLAGKTVAISGFGNVAWGTARKVTELGGKVITLSGPDGFIHDPDGVSGEKIDYMLTMRHTRGDEVAGYAERFNVRFVPGQRPWVVRSDVAIPCAIHNELNEADAADLVKNGCQIVAEASNMGVTAAARDVLRAAGVCFAPGKAVNAGGVVVSGMEMTQNRTGERWSPDRVDAALHGVMQRIHRLCRDTAEQYDRPGDYAFGANVASFLRVANAILEQGAV